MHKTNKHIYTYIHMHKHPYKHTKHKHIYTHTDTHAHTDAHTHTQTYVCLHIYDSKIFYKMKKRNIFMAQSSYVRSYSHSNAKHTLFSLNLHLPYHSIKIYIFHVDFSAVLNQHFDHFKISLLGCNMKRCLKCHRRI